MTTGIRLEGITKRFGSAVALERVDLEIEPGSFTTLVGPSGCGKSTLPNVIAGLEEPTSGRVFFDGEPAEGKGPAERDVAFVFQSYALYPHLTVYENLAFPLRMAKRPRAEIDARVRETAEKLELGPLLGRKPRALSGGQQQRVALGRAMVRRPKAFLLDEPLSNLDATLRLAMRAELKRLHREIGATFVFVTHDQTEAMSLSDSIAVMNGGRILQHGDPLGVWRDPDDVFVGRFIGSPPMNVLPARFSGREGTVAGVRPQDVRLAPPGRADGHSGTVTLVEPLGPEFHVRVDSGGEEIVAVTAAADGAPPEAGSAVTLVIAAGAIRLFDEKTGRRVV